MNLVELADFAVEEVASGNFVHLSSSDINGAFDAAPRHLPIQALKRVGADGYILRFVTRWLRGRTFRIRLRTAAGTFPSRPRPKTGGLPPV